MGAEKKFEDFCGNLETSNKTMMSFDDMVYARELRQRRLYLFDIIDEESVISLVKSILDYNRSDRDLPVEERVPIVLYISSVGGDVKDGYHLLNAILCSKTPIWTVVTGYAYSMAFYITVAGQKRYAMPYSTFLMHDGSEFLFNSSSKVGDTVDFSKRSNKKLEDLIMERTSIDKKLIDKKRREEWYLFADEAKDYNVIDEIIVPDDFAIDKIL